MKRGGPVQSRQGPRRLDPADVLNAVRGLQMPEPSRYRVGSVGGRYVGADDGTGIEFRHHRPYVPGDDARQVDWQLFARSRRLYNRIRISELAPTLGIVLDVSASMRIPSFESKFLPALELALALAFIGVESGYMVQFATFPDISDQTSVRSWTSPLDVIGGAGRLQTLLPEGANDVGALTMHAEHFRRKKAFSIVISDFLVDISDDRSAPSELQKAADAIPVGIIPSTMRRRLEASSAVAIQAVERLAHPEAGAVLVRLSGFGETDLPEATVVDDVEGGGCCVIAANAEARRLYAEAHNTHGLLLEAMARHIGLGFVSLTSGPAAELSRLAEKILDAVAVTTGSLRR